jgi:hypothetical protein
MLNWEVFGSNKTKGPKQDSQNERGMFSSMLRFHDYDAVK